MRYDYLVGEELPGLLVDGELGSLLVGLLHDHVLDLAVHTLVHVARVHLHRKQAQYRLGICLTFLTVFIVSNNLHKILCKTVLRINRNIMHF